MAITCAQGFAFCLTTLAIVALVAGNVVPIWRLKTADSLVTIDMTTWRTCGDVDIDAINLHVHHCSSTRTFLKDLQLINDFLAAAAQGNSAGSQGGSGSGSDTCATAMRDVLDASAFGSIGVGLLFVGHLIALGFRHRITLVGFCLTALCLPIAMIPAAGATVAVVQTFCGGTLTLHNMPDSNVGVGLYLLWAAFALFSASSVMGCACVAKRRLDVSPYAVTGVSTVQYVAFQPVPQQQLQQQVVYGQPQQQEACRAVYV